MKNIFILSLCAFLVLTGCADKKEQMVEKAKTSLEKSLKKPKSLEVIGVAQPDSAFGNYLSTKEIQAVVKIMDQVTQTIMKRTKNMTEFDVNDNYVMKLATRQMAAGSDLTAKQIHSDKKGAWTGWKVKIDYKCKDEDDEDLRAEKWYYFDKEGKNITDSLELPLP